MWKLTAGVATLTCVSDGKTQTDRFSFLFSTKETTDHTGLTKYTRLFIRSLNHDIMVDMWAVKVTFYFSSPKLQVWWNSLLYALF